MQQVSDERFQQFLHASQHYFNWDIILRDAEISEVSDKGDQYEIACPFHEDWSPSMRLNKVTGVYHCFSCGRKGTYTKFLWELAGKQVPYAQYCEQILKANPSMQAELKFSSLIVTEKTLDKEFEKRRVFNRETHLGSDMPISVLASKVRAIDDSWKTLVLSLSLLQNEVKTDSVLATVQKQNIKINAPKDKISMMDLFND